MSDWYQIENSYFTVQVTSTGAEIKRLFAKPWHRELLWNPYDEASKKIWNRSSPILFPIVGKLKDDSYNLKEKVYQMSQHGFARDRNFKCLECSSTEMEFLLEADQETFKLYPFCFELRVKYVLEDKKINIMYSVKNVDRQDIYFSIGAHPAFDTAKIENYEIHFEKQEKGFYQLSNGLVNWKQLKNLDSDTLVPDRELFSKDALVFKNVKSKYIDLVDHKRHEVIRVNGTNTPYLGIWAKDSVPFICIEPWFGVSDDADHDKNLETKKGIQTLAMGKTFNFSFSIELMTTAELI
jgi:galactose mutarotase-like enzyme